MKATRPFNGSANSSTFPTFTVLAASCAMMLSVSVNAANTDAVANRTDTTNTTTPSAKVPSAIDSSRRLIRQSSSSVSTSAPQTTGTQATASQTGTQPTAMQAAQTSPANNPTSGLQPNRTPLASSQASTPLSTKTRIYQPGPMSSDGIDISKGQLPSIPTPTVQLSAVSFVPTTLIPQQQGVGSDVLDVSLLDDFINEVSPNARHYPTNFPNRSQRYYTREKIKVLTDWIDPYAKSPKASYDVLIRAAKLNGMGRNLDLGSDYTVRGGEYIDRAVKLKPDDGEANFLYGVMLSEGGGFKEGQKYLDRAVSLGYTEAEQSLAQSDLLNDKRDAALDRLRRLQQQLPNNQNIPKQIQIVENGGFYIWDLPAPNINIQPNS